MSHAATPIPLNVLNPAGASLFSNVGRAQAEATTGDLAIVYEAVENQSGDTLENCQALGAQFSSCSVTNLHIKDAAGVLNDGNWKLYFHSIRRILRVDSNEFTGSFVNGDLHFIEPTDSFEAFSGEVKTLKFITEFSHLVETDFMPRYWLVRDGAAPFLIPNTDEETNERAYAAPITGENRQIFAGEANLVANPGIRFEKNTSVDTLAKALTATEIQSRIVPQPRSIAVGAETLDISAGISFAGMSLPPASLRAIAARQQTFLRNGGVIVQSSINPSLPAEGYELTINSSGITLTGGDEAGLFNGAQSVLSLVQPGISTLPSVNVSDAPRFAFRGMHIDVARNFHSVETLKRLIDQMAAYKLNKLHLHLSDDEGWRLQIPSLPELTSIGARRSFQLDESGNVNESNGLMPQLGSGPASNNQGSGFLTRAQFIDLLQYATARFIEVIPAIDMPGHARAAVISMRAHAAAAGSPDDITLRIDDPDDTSRYLTIQHYDDGFVNPCIPGTYRFIETVVTEIKAMYTEAGAELGVFHMGGDEANNIFKGGGFNADSGIDLASYDFPWQKSPACVAFINETPEVASLEALQPYFVQRVSQIVANAGIPTLYAYQDIYDGLNASDLSTTNAGVGFWEVLTTGGFNGANAVSNRGFDTVIAVPDFLYFDFPEEVSPEERGQYWATRFTDVQKIFSFAPENLPQNAETSVTREGNAWSATGNDANQGYLGMQGQLWSETVRTPEQVDYMIFPRLLALAERAWHRASWEQDYQPGRAYAGGGNQVDQTALNADYARFAAALGNKELLKLDAAGVQYRIPVPGARAGGAALEMNVAYPGLPLEYSVANDRFVSFDGAAESGSATRVRALSADGARAGREDAIQ